MLWGIADFRHRFGRMPEGMWLAETAVDVETLEVLAEAGIRFTILAPRQARRWRKLGEQGLGGDPRRHRPVAGLSLPPAVGALDRPVLLRRASSRSRSPSSGCWMTASGSWSGSSRGSTTAASMPSSCTSPPTANRTGITIAHGDMALAYVLDRLAQDPDVRLTNYGEFLELHPPEWEVEIHENSSWSCAHGVERWRSDCGCRIRGDWHQKWRGPLRAGARRPQGPARPPLQHPRAASAFPTPGPRATPTSR